MEIFSEGDLQKDYLKNLLIAEPKSSAPQF